MNFNDKKQTLVLPAEREEVKSSPRLCLSTPGSGLSLAEATQNKGANVRQAVAILVENLLGQEIRASFQAMFTPRWRGPVKSSSGMSGIAERAAWNLVGIWLLAQAEGGIDAHNGITEAEEWFLGAVRVPTPLLTGFVSQKALRQAHQTLLGVKLDSDFWDLLPYIFEVYGPGSRASVMRDPKTATARAAKKRDGIFYTPSDVADFMVIRTIENYRGALESTKFLDPACGTGVFHIAILRAAEKKWFRDGKFNRLDFITRRLYGCDVSGQALDACAFVLLRECLSGIGAEGISPWAAWHMIRLNMVEADALTIEPPSPGQNSEQHPAAEILAAVRASVRRVPSSYVGFDPSVLQNEDLNPDCGLNLFAGASLRLGDLFPEAADGFDMLIGNPPYAPLGDRDDYLLLGTGYHSLTQGKGGSRENSFPLFIEMMWRLTLPGANASVLVTPLSIAFHSGKQMEACRNAMTWRGGHWQFAFFDREPHGLFGEEVKTRNAILFRFENTNTPKCGDRAEIETGPLRKWTSRTRKQLFQTITFTPIGPANLTSGIPKLQGRGQAEAFRILRNRLERFPSLCSRMAACPPSEAFQESATPRVFVGGTAYNFLNVYRSGFLTESERPIPLSESSVHCFEFGSETEAQAAFAILSSRLVFWLWHVLGDGFHVAGWLFKEIPFSRHSFTEHTFDILASLGTVLWEKVRACRFVSVNGGRQTIGFRSLSCLEERDAIDSLLVAAAKLTPGFRDELGEIVRNNVVVDCLDPKRNHMNQYFTASVRT